MLGKILLFPFRIISNIFSSKEKRELRRRKREINRNINEARKYMKKDLDKSKKKKLREQIKSMQDKKRHLIKTFRYNKKLEKDPKNMKYFRKKERHEKRLRKSI